MNPQIREFRPDDYDEALALWRATPGIGLSEADSRPAITAYLARNPGNSFVALAEGKIVATVLCGHDGRRGLIHHLMCATSHRRLGLSRALLDAALAQLAEQGIDKCHMMVFTDNEDGCAFWRAVGASRRGELSLYSLPTGAVQRSRAQAPGI